MNANLFNPGLGADLYAHPGRTLETLKTPLDRAKEHRLEAHKHIPKDCKCHAFVVPPGE